MTDKKSSKVKVGRDAKTGKFVTLEYANRHPKRTIVQTINKATPKQK